MKRRNFSFILFWMLLITVLLPVLAFSQIDDDNMPVKIRNVRFEGVHSVNKKLLAESLACSVPPLWKFWASHPQIARKDLYDDILRIKQYYQSQGYYQTTAELTITPVNPGKELTAPADDEFPPEESPEKPADSAKTAVPEYDVMFQVHEGPPVFIRDVTMNCLCELETITETQVQDEIPLKPGKIFKTEDYDQSKILIRKLLGNRAYPFVKVTGNAVVDLNDNSVTISFKIDPGELYKFGNIRIAGHEDYVREDAIRRALTFKGGEEFSAKAVDDSRRNLFDLNVFKTAVIRMAEPNRELHTVPIDIEVKPRKQRSIKLGVGYGTDDGLRLQVAWSYRNLTGRADRLTFRARRSDILENISGEYLLPYFLSARNNLVSTAGFEREIKDYYTLKRTSAEVNLYRKMEEHWFSTFGYNLEINRPNNIRDEKISGVIDPRDTENFLVSSVKFHIERSTVDDVLNSRKGTSVGLSIENASGYLGSEISYIRPGIDAKAFIPLPWDMVLAGRLDYKTIEKSGDTDYIPISKQFFLGGSKSVRGYGFEKLGVIDKNDVIRDISGLSSFYGNLELRFPLYKDFSGVLFLDSGALYTDSYQIDLKSLRYTSGAGLRYNTIVGPIQLDFGYQLNPPKSTASDDPLLTGLLDKNRWYLHFNIGQAF